MTDNNIYIALELFLDPPITDPGALQQDLEARISQWNKQINANPKFKSKVTIAKTFLKKGLTNLKTQAETARKEKLKQLQQSIAELRLAGSIDAVGQKFLKGKFKDFFTDTTLQSEVGESATEEAAPPFVVPVQPQSLQCSKPISAAEMQHIQTDLMFVEQGHYKNLYDLLGLVAATATEDLLEKAKAEADRIRRITKKDTEADALNRLIGKTLHFFKEDSLRIGYDMALKRTPFEQLCEDKFKLRSIKKEINWRIYESSIEETIGVGFSQEEAVWLVYEYYCITRQCPAPKPELTKSLRPTSTSFDRGSWKPFVALLNDGVKTAQTAVGTLFNNIVRDSEQTGSVQAISSSTARPSSAETTLSPVTATPERTASAGPQGVLQALQSGFQWFLHAINKKHEPLATHKVITQFDPASTNSLLQELKEIQKDFQRAKGAPEQLAELFQQTDALVETYRYQSVSQQALSQSMKLRAEICRPLCDRAYDKQQFDIARQYYKAILDDVPTDYRAGKRSREIDEYKMTSFEKIESLLSQKKYEECIATLYQLKSRLGRDTETIDFLNGIPARIEQAGISKQVLQDLADHKKWQTMDALLEMAPPQLQTLFAKAWESTRQRVAESDKAVGKIREALRTGQHELAQQIFSRLSEYISDHRELEILRQQVSSSHDHAQKFNHEIDLLCTKKHWCRAENVLRNYLKENPVQDLELVPVVEVVSEGFEKFQNLVRFWLFVVLGGITFILGTPILKQMFTTQLEHQEGNIYFAAILMTVVQVLIFYAVFYVLNGGLIRLLPGRTEIPPTLKIKSLIGIVILMTVSLCFARSYPALPNWVNEKIASAYQQQRVAIQNSNEYSSYDSLEMRLQSSENAEGLIKGMCLIIAWVIFYSAIVLYFFAWTLFLYSWIRRCIGTHNRSPSLILFGCCCLVIPLAIKGWLFFPYVLMWCIASFAVFRDYRDELDSSFGREDLRDFFKRYMLLTSLRESDFGKSSLLETYWYHDVEQQYRQWYSQE
ncbi:MAG: hypothetical protein ACRC10_00990 [Thermoguttaceae bacterium]